MMKELDKELIYCLKDLNKEQVTELYFKTDKTLSLEEFVKNVPLGHSCDSIYYCDGNKAWMFTRDECSDVNALTLFK